MLVWLEEEAHLPQLEVHSRVSFDSKMRLEWIIYMLKCLTALLHVFAAAWQGFLWCLCLHTHPSFYDDYEYSSGEPQANYG